MYIDRIDTRGNNALLTVCAYNTNLDIIKYLIEILRINFEYPNNVFSFEKLEHIFIN